MGRKFLASLVGRSGLGIADNMARKSSLEGSPSHTHRYIAFSNKSASRGLASTALRVCKSSPNVPGEADAFILETVACSSSRVIGAFIMSILA